MRFNIRLAKPAAHALRPVIPDNAWGPRITASSSLYTITKYYLIYIVFGLYHHPSNRLGSGAWRVIATKKPLSDSVKNQVSEEPLYI